MLANNRTIENIGEGRAFRIMRRLVLMLLTFIFLTLHTKQTFAEDTALIIGIGKYLDATHNLPGIDLDVASMENVAQLLGYKSIILLRDKSATESAIVNTLNQIKNTLGPDDRFLFYFSGHGTRIPDLNGDERDQVDEALAASDVRLTKIGQTETLDGVVVDDQLSKILKSFNTKHTFAIIDACHSGTVTKRSFVNNISKESRILNGATAGKKKMYSWSGVKPSNESFNPFEDEVVSSPFISISAAGDDEYAIATTEGSIFTQALALSIKNAINREGFFQDRELTPHNIAVFSSNHISSRVKQSEQYSPELSGNTRLFHQPLTFVTPNTNGPNWTRLNNLIQSNDLQMHSYRNDYQVGELLSSEITIPFNVEGYLNIIQVDSRDNVTVLFPNKYRASNKLRLTKGVLNINKALNGFNIRASGNPTGNVMLYALLTTTPVNLYETSLGNRNKSGQLLDTLVTMSEKGMSSISRSFIVEPTSEITMINLTGKLALKIVP